MAKQMFHSIKECINLANQLISLCNLSIPKVSTIKVIDSSFINKIFQSIYQVPDLLSSSDSIEEAHNIQVIIDTLSLEILGISLSHITGEDIVAGDVDAIFNLLEVMESLLLDLIKHSSVNVQNKSSLTSKIRKQKRALSPPSHEHEQTVPMPSSSKYSRIDQRPGENIKIPFHVQNAPGSSTSLTKRPMKRKISRFKPLQEDASVDKEDICNMYKTNITKKLHVYMENYIQSHCTATPVKHQYQRILRNSRSSSQIPPCKKSYLLPYNLRPRSSSQTTPKKLFKEPSEIQKKSNKIDMSDENIQEKVNLIEGILKELPEVDLSPAILFQMLETYNKHLVQLHSLVKKSLFKKSKTQIQSEKAVHKQAKLSDIMNKEMRHEEYLKMLKETKEYERKIKSRINEARLRSARTKRYFKEYHAEMSKKMQKPNYKEELLIKRTFKKSLELEKEQIHRLCRKAKETEESDAKQHKVYLEALENYFQSQFSLLAETLDAERKELEEREKAQRKVMRDMQIEFRNHLEHEIHTFQEDVVEAYEDIHFRELDSENYLDALRARLTAKK